MNEGISTVEIGRLCKLLEGVYGRPDFTAEHGPLDELVLTILSQTTTAANYTRAFDSLRRRFPGWEAVREAAVEDVEDAIRSGGLAKVKAQRIKEVLEDLVSRQGKLSLDCLYEMKDADARDYLMEFRGVGIKTASCVLMFSMNRPTFPVDTHVHRLSQRLALISKEVDAEKAHSILGDIVPDSDVYSLHVNLVTHGRRICKARNPACDACVLLECCGYGHRALRSGGV